MSRSSNLLVYFYLIYFTEISSEVYRLSSIRLVSKVNGDRTIYTQLNLQHIKMYIRTCIDDLRVCT